MSDTPERAPEQPRKKRRRIERKTDWTLSHAAPAQAAEGVKALFAQDIWQGRDADALYAWKFEQNPAGPGHIEMAINSEGAVVAAFCYMPWRFSLGERTVNGSQMVDAYTLLNYRGQDIVVKQMNRGRDRLFEAGAPITIAFPNSNMVPGHKKNNGTHVGWLRRYTRPLSTRYLLERRVKWAPLAAFLSVFTDLGLRLIARDSWLRRPRDPIEDITEPDAAFDRFWQRYAALYPTRLMSRKTADYLKWKHAGSPNPSRTLHALRRDGEVLGWIVLEQHGRSANIVDIAAIDDEIFDQLVTWSLARLRRARVDTVVFFALEDHPAFEKLEPFRFVARTEQEYFYIYTDPNWADRDRFNRPEAWMITLGDCDITAL